MITGTTYMIHSILFQNKYNIKNNVRSTGKCKISNCTHTKPANWPSFL